MDDLAISPEELAQVIGTNFGSESKPAAPSRPRGIALGDLSGLSPMADNMFPAPPMPSPPPQRSGQPSFGADVTARPVQFAPLDSNSMVTSSTNLDLLLGVTLQVSVELGRTKMNIEEILHLGPGSVVELDKLAGEPVDVLVNDKMIAKGEVVVLDDRFGVRITDVLSPAQRLNSLR